MTLKKLMGFCLIVTYLYTLTFGIFMTDFWRIPAPIILGIVMMLFIEQSAQPFAYYYEMGLFTIALFIYDGFGMHDYKAFVASITTILTCAVFFNYFVGLSKQRFNLSVVVFLGLLFLSMILMVLDHSYQSVIDPIRSVILGEEVKQSPAGLAITQFTFGYQVAAFTAFIFVLTYKLKGSIILKVIALFGCAACIYLGMNRSAFISFIVVAVLFLIVYYRFKGLVLIAMTLLIGFLAYTYVIKDNLDDKNNILAKNQAKEANDFNRIDLSLENLKIYADYPFGLIFYGKDWNDVSYKNSYFQFGITSHNAYLMFITYLGPFLGLALLGALYYRIAVLFNQTVKHIRLKNHAMLLCFLFAFIAVSINALSHNGWLLSADGPTVFLYFGTLQCAKIYIPRTQDSHTFDPALQPQ
ncbi:O-antigen ligase family protein [Mucilaginibacter sp.]|uniref:O-antigen ligase family protein n=1 Tax=Mucilaginibacter sp. TaxID=1882438 RepID=UPI002606B5AA|nr:O-antigen ligase family protein [Mucilaginibacter sp.]MDB5031902.1 O-Antigen ligase [Mucilaginibacter sp.]